MVVTELLALGISVPTVYGIFVYLHDIMELPFPHEFVTGEFNSMLIGKKKKSVYETKYFLNNMQ